MQAQDFPALYRSADKLSLDSQRHFLLALKAHLIFLVIAAYLSIVDIKHWTVAACQLFVLLGALSCSIYLFSKRLDRHWYTARAVAESIKTITWRYVSRAEPFDKPDESARDAFHEKLKAVVAQNRDVAQSLTDHLDGQQITDTMTTMRGQPLDQRRALYANERINEQLRWYSNKSKLNRRASRNFFVALIVVNSCAVIFAMLRIKFSDASFWPTDVLVAAAASLLTWMQTKRFSELAASYALAANEISIVKEQSLLPASEDAFSAFVGDAENAFSREHTQWIARKDV